MAGPSGCRALTGNITLSSARVLARRMDGPILWRAVQRRTTTASGRLALARPLLLSFFACFYSWLACVDTLGIPREAATPALHVLPRQRLT